MVFVITGCATIGPKGPTYPTNAKAKHHYDLGGSYLNDGSYEKAALEYRRSIEIESEAFLSHARIATAYYAQQKYLDAASSFKSATDLTGGPKNAGPLPILQALSLMRGGKIQEAEELLFIGSGNMSGIWKTAAGYLLGSVSEADYLEKAPQSNLSFPYLIIGIKNVVDKNSQKAHENLSKVLDLAGRGTWRRIIAREELRLLQ